VCRYRTQPHRQPTQPRGSRPTIRKPDLRVGQGVSWIGGSFMTGEAVWAVIGALAIVFGVVLLRPPRSRLTDDEPD
jgi:hypothetical protein